MESKFKFINFPTTLDIFKANFNKLNPLVKYISPFNKLYEKYSEKEYNKIMWAITVLNYPDEKKNILYREDEPTRKKIIKRELGIEFKREDVVQASEMFSVKCLTAVQRSLKEEIDTLVKRATYMKGFDYNEATLKEIKDFEYLRSQTSKIYERYEQLQDKLLKEDKTEGEVYGGRQETLAEQRII